MAVLDSFGIFLHTLDVAVEHLPRDLSIVSSCNKMISKRYSPIFLILAVLHTAYCSNGVVPSRNLQSEKELVAMAGRNRIHICLERIHILDPDASHGVVQISVGSPLVADVIRPWHFVIA